MLHRERVGYLKIVRDHLAEAISMSAPGEKIQRCNSAPPRGASGTHPMRVTKSVADGLPMRVADGIGLPIEAAISSMNTAL